MIYAVFHCVIASAVFVLAWLALKEEIQKIDDLPVLATCQSGALVILPVKLMVPLLGYA